MPFKLLLSSAAVVVFAFAGAPALAEEDLSSGNYWYPVCRDGAGQAASIQCATYIKGMHEGQAYHAFATVTRVLYCTRPGVTFGQMAAIFSKFLADNPDRRHEFAPRLFTDAMTRSFPCAPE